jgi:hypothetical protein
VCAACRSSDGPLEGARVVKQQMLRQLEEERGLGRGTLLWQLHAGIALCGQFSARGCHSRYDLAVERVPRRRLSHAVIALALAFGPAGERALSDFPDDPEREEQPLP